VTACLTIPQLDSGHEIVILVVYTTAG